MICLKCGENTSNFNYCNNCKDYLTDKTGLNFKEIKEIENLKNECQELKKILYSNNCFEGPNLFNKIVNIVSKNKKSEIIDNSFILDTLCDITNKLNCLKKKLELGKIDLRELPNSKITEYYRLTIPYINNEYHFLKNEIIVFKIYKVLSYIQVKNIYENIILFPKFIVPTLNLDDIDFNNKIYTIEEIVNPCIVKKPENCYFYTSSSFFIYKKNNKLTEYDIENIFFKKYKDNWRKLIDNYEESKKIESIGLSLKLENIKNKFYK